MIIKLAYVINSNMILKLFSWLPTLLKEIWAKPNFLQMSFMWIFGEYLFNRNFLLTTPMNSKPYNTKATPTQKCNSFEFLRKSIPKLLILLWSKINFNIKIILSMCMYFNGRLIISCVACCSIWYVVCVKTGFYRSRTYSSTVSLSGICSLDLLWFAWFFLLKIVTHIFVKHFLPNLPVDKNF